jgi:hypothetical protein
MAQSVAHDSPAPKTVSMSETVRVLMCVFVCKTCHEEGWGDCVNACRLGTVRMYLCMHASCAALHDQVSRGCTRL